MVLADNHDAIEQLGDGTLESSGSESRFDVVFPERAGITGQVWGVNGGLDM